MGILRKTPQPRVHVPRSPLEYAADVLGIVLVVLVWLVPLAYWSSLPETIPARFGAAGEVSGRMGKGPLLILPAMGVFLYVVLTVLSFFPHIWNYPWKITEANAERQYRLGRGFVAILKLDLLVTFMALEWMIVLSARREALVPGFGVVVIAIAVVPTLIIAAYFVLSYAARSGSSDDEASARARQRGYDR